MQGTTAQVTRILSFYQRHSETQSNIEIHYTAQANQDHTE